MKHSELQRTCFCLCKHDGRLEGRNMNVCSHLKFHHCFLHAFHIKDHLNKILDWLSEFWFCPGTYCQFLDSFFILEGKNSIRISKITKDKSNRMAAMATTQNQFSVCILWLAWSSWGAWDIALTFWNKMGLKKHLLTNLVDIARDGTVKNKQKVELSE